MTCHRNAPKLASLAPVRLAESFAEKGPGVNQFGRRAREASGGNSAMQRTSFIKSVPEAPPMRRLVWPPDVANRVQGNGRLDDGRPFPASSARHYARRLRAARTAPRRPVPSSSRKWLPEPLPRSPCNWRRRSRDSRAGGRFSGGKSPPTGTSEDASRAPFEALLSWALSVTCESRSG